MKFNPCTGECTEDGTHCQGCGRAHADIAETKRLVKEIVSFAQSKGYENVEDFVNAVAKSALKKLQNPA